MGMYAYLHWYWFGDVRLPPEPPLFLRHYHASEDVMWPKHETLLILAADYEGEPF